MCYQQQCSAMQLLVQPHARFIAQLVLIVQRIYRSMSESEMSGHANVL